MVELPGLLGGELIQWMREMPRMSARLPTWMMVKGDILHHARKYWKRTKGGPLWQI